MFSSPRTQFGLAKSPPAERGSLSIFPSHSMNLLTGADLVAWENVIDTPRMGSVPCLPPTETVLGETRREKKKKATLFLMSVAPKDNLDVLQRGDLPRCHEARLPAKQHHAKQEEAAFKGSPVGQRWVRNQAMSGCALRRSFFRWWVATTRARTGRHLPSEGVRDGFQEA